MRGLGNAAPGGMISSEVDVYEVLLPDEPV